MKEEYGVLRLFSSFITFLQDGRMKRVWKRNTANDKSLLSIASCDTEVVRPPSRSSPLELLHRTPSGPRDLQRRTEALPQLSSWKRHSTAGTAPVQAAPLSLLPRPRPGDPEASRRIRDVTPLEAKTGVVPRKRLLLSTPEHAAVAFAQRS